MAAAAGLTAAVGRNFGELAAATADDAAQAINLATALQDRNIRHMHVHFASGATTVARLTSLITGIPFSFTAHAVDIFHESVQDEDLRLKLEQAHHAVTISQYNMRYLRRRFPGVDVPAPSGTQRPGTGALPVPGAPPARSHPADLRRRTPGGEEGLPASAARGRRTA